MTRVTLRLPSDVHKRLTESARTSRRSINQTIVDLLSEALGCGVRQRPDETPLDAERRRIREALGDLVVEFTAEDLAPMLTHPLGSLDAEAIYNSMPRLDPPLSQTIIDEREDRV